MYIDHNPLLTEAITELTDFNFLMVLGKGKIFKVLNLNFQFGLPDDEGLYWISTAHPVTRFPVFFMGVCAGVLCMRIQSGDLTPLECKKVGLQKADLKEIYI